MRKILPILLILLATLASAGETIWTSDLAAAKEKALKEGKTLFIVFTGSDWCPGCKMLETEILTKPEFTAEIVKKYVPVVIDFPKAAELLPDLKKQNQALAKIAGLTALPSVALMDNEGRLYGFKKGFDADCKVDKYIKDLEAFEGAKRLRDECFAEAAKAETPVRKAIILHRALMIVRDAGVFDGWTLCGYDAVVDEIIKGDADNAHGFKAGWTYTIAVIKSRDFLVEKKYKEAIEVLDVFIKDFKDYKDFVQKSLYAKAQIYALSGDSANCLLTLAEVIEIDPNSQLGKESMKVLEQLAKDAIENKEEPKK